MPIAAWIGETFGWRVAFATVAVLGFASAAWVYAAMPDGVKPAALSRAAWKEALTQPALIAIVLVTALQTAPSDLRDHFISSLSQRAGATLRDDLAAASPKRVSEVEAAQKEVIEAAMKLAGEGKLTMPARGGE